MTSSWWLFQNAIRHLSEQNFFSFLPLVCSKDLPHCIHTDDSGFAGCLRRWLLTVSGERPTISAIRLYPNPCSARLRIWFCICNLICDSFQKCIGRARTPHSPDYCLLYHLNNLNSFGADEFSVQKFISDVTDIIDLR